MLIEKKDLAKATFIVCFVLVISVFAATSIVLNYLDESGNLVTGNAVVETSTEEKNEEVFVKGLFEQKYALDIVEANDSLGWCNLTESVGDFAGICLKPTGRFTLQMLVKNTGEYRIDELRESFQCDDNEFWSFLGDASSGTIYDQEINKDPHIAVIEPGNSFVYKIIGDSEDIKGDYLVCQVSFFSKETPILIKKKIFLQFPHIDFLEDDKAEEDKSYLNKIVSSIDRNDLRRLTYG